MKNKNILLKDLLIQRETELILEQLKELDLDQAKELGGKALTKGKELGQKAIDKLPDAEQREKAKQQAAKAIKLIASKSKEIAQKVEQSAAFQKAKEEISKEIKDPKRVKAILSKLAKLSTRVLQILSSTITDNKKRELLNAALKAATPISIVGIIYNIIEAIVEAEVEVPLIGTIGTGLNIPDVPLLDAFATALPLIAALRLTIGIYQLKPIVDLGKAAGKAVVKRFSKGDKEKNTSAPAVNDPFAKFRNLDENEANLRLITTDDKQALLSLFNAPE